MQVRVALPAHLRTLASVDGEVRVELKPGENTVSDVIDAVERDFPMLRGTIRDQLRRERRAYLRYYACGRDLSHEGADAALPEAVLRGEDAFIVLGAISGG